MQILGFKPKVKNISQIAMSLSKEDDQNRWCPAIACFQGFLFAAFRLLRYGTCAFPSVILCDIPLSANQSKHRYVPRGEDDGKKRRYFVLEKCLRKTDDGLDCKTLKKCWSYESSEQCLCYYREHFEQSSNHRKMCEDEVDHEIFAANPKIKIKEESYESRERDRKYWENEKAKAAKEQRAHELEAAKGKGSSTAAKPIKRELSPAAATAASSSNSSAAELLVNRRALMGLKRGLEDISASLKPQINTIRKMEQAYRNCDEATKAAVAMIDKVLVDEGAKCSDMPRVLE